MSMRERMARCEASYAGRRSVRKDRSASNRNGLRMARASTSRWNGSTHAWPSKIGVWVFRSLTIAKDAVLKVFGSDAIALIAQGDLVVDGTVSVRGDCARGIAGPGAADPTSARTGKPGESKNTNVGFKFICGGGGGNGTAGGDGGWASGTNPENTTVQALGGEADARRAAGGSCSPGQDGNVSGAPELAAGPCAVGDIAVAASGGGGGFGSVAVRTRDATFVTDDGGVVNPAPARSIAAVK